MTSQDPPLTVRLLTVREAAALLHVHPMTIYRLIERGDLPASRFSPRTIRIREPDARAFMAAALPALAPATPAQQMPARLPAAPADGTAQQAAPGPQHA